MTETPDRADERLDHQIRHSYTEVLNRDDSRVDDPTAFWDHMRVELFRSAYDAGLAPGPIIDISIDGDREDFFAKGKIAATAATTVTRIHHVPGAAEGPLGPQTPTQYGQPHVYARAVQSGAGNCVCGDPLGSWLHTEAAPGVPIPEAMRRG